MKAQSAFELLSLTKGKLIEIEVLSQKNRQPDQNPGVKITVEYVVANHLLGMFDPALKSALFTKNSGKTAKDQTGTLDGVDPVSDMPNLSGIGQHVKAIKWAQEMTGYVCEIDHGRGGKSNIHLTGCILDGWRFTPKEGGSVTVKHSIEAADASEADFGKLAKYKSREIEFTLAAPVAQDDLADQGNNERKAPPPAPSPAPKPAAKVAAAKPPAPAPSGPTPESALADAVASGNEAPKPDAAAGEPGGQVVDVAQAAIDKARAQGNWPFPKDGAPKPDAGPADPNTELERGIASEIGKRGHVGGPGKAAK